MTKEEIKNFDWLSLFYCVGITLLTIFILINIFWCVYAFVKYGNTPISEIPSWAIWYMFWRGR